MQRAEWSETSLAMAEEKAREHRLDYEQQRAKRLEMGYRRGAMYRHQRTKETIISYDGPELTIVIKGKLLVLSLFMAITPNTPPPPPHTHTCIRDTVQATEDEENFLGKFSVLSLFMIKKEAVCYRPMRQTVICRFFLLLFFCIFSCLLPHKLHLK